MSDNDTIWLDEFVTEVKQQPPLKHTLTPSEVRVVDSVVDEFGNIGHDAWTNIDDDLFFPKDKVHKDGETVGIVRCVGTVYTSPERLLGWFFHMSDHDKAIHIKRNGPNAERYPNKEVARINAHHNIYYVCRKLPFPLAARDFLQRGIFAQYDDDKFVLAYKFIDESESDVPPFRQSTLKLGEKR